MPKPALNFSPLGYPTPKDVEAFLVQHSNEFMQCEKTHCKRLRKKVCATRWKASNSAWSPGRNDHGSAHISCEGCATGKKIFRKYGAIRMPKRKAPLKPKGTDLKIVPRKQVKTLNKLNPSDLKLDKNRECEFLRCSEHAVVGSNFCVHHHTKNEALISRFGICNEEGCNRGREGEWTPFCRKHYQAEYARKKKQSVHKA